MKGLCRTFRAYYEEISLENQTFQNIFGIECWGIGKEGWEEAPREITLQISDTIAFNLEFYSWIHFKRIYPKEMNLLVWVNHVVQTKNTLHIFVEHFDIL